MTFADLGLSPETLKAIEDVGYTTPTPIQEKAIPHVLMGRDVLGIAQTGTGKTAGFTLPMIEILANGRAKARMPRSLILAPTRELATQVADNFTTYGKYHKLDMALLIGGESMGDQMRALDKGVDVLIATPGRLLDLFERGKVLLRDVKVLVIDEADRMLDMGFIPDVERIVGLLPPLRQTLFFSATMDKEIGKLADAFLTNPREVRIERRATAAETVTQHLAVVPRVEKRETLRHILRTENVRNAFIFCNRKRDVDVLNRSLRKHGFNSISLHGDMDQPTRNEMLRRFKDGEADLLVCSDVAARGLDIDDVSHVINFDVPTHSEDYVHRIGRTGRAGKDGQAFSLATPDDEKYVTSIEKLLGRSIPRMAVPELEESGAGAASADTGGMGADNGADNGSGTSASKERERDRDRDRSNRRRRGGRGRGADDAASARDEAQAARTGRSRRGGRSRDDDRDGVRSMSHGDNVVAFGDHTPAFFLTESLVPMGSPPTGGSDEAEDKGDRGRSGKRGKSRTRDAAKDETRSGRKSVPTRRGERKRHGRRGDDPADQGAGEAQAEEASLDDASADAALPAGGDGPVGAEEVVTDGADAVEAPEKPARKRRATRRKSTREATAGATDQTDTSETDTSETDTSETEGAAVSGDKASAADETAEAAPPKPKRTRRRKTAEPTAAETGADTGAESESGGEAEAARPSAPKARRSRRKTTSAAGAEDSEKQADTPGDSSENDAAAPETANETASETAPRSRRRSTKTSSRAKTAAGSGSASASASLSEDGEEVPAKPKRTRRRTTDKTETPTAASAGTAVPESGDIQEQAASGPDAPELSGPGATDDQAADA